MIMMIEFVVYIEFDDFDCVILCLVQQNNQLLYGEIVEQVNFLLLLVCCWFKCLCEMGVIEVDVLFVQFKGCVVEVVVFVIFGIESVEVVGDFWCCMCEVFEVVQVYFVVGNVDFVLIVQVEDFESYEVWGECNFMVDLNIKCYDLYVVWLWVKFSMVLYML